VWSEPSYQVNKVVLQKVRIGEDEKGRVSSDKSNTRNLKRNSNVRVSFAFANE